MTTAPAETTTAEPIAGDALLRLADRVVDGAAGDEHVEVVVSDGIETEVRVHEDEVESLSVARTQGVGIRVVAGGRQGFAWAGTFDDDAVRAALAEARDNAMFGTVDEHVALVEPDGVPVSALQLFDEGAVGVPTATKVELARRAERAARAADDRICAIESTQYADFLGADAIVSTTGIRASSRESGSFIALDALAAAGDELQSGFGFSLARRPDALDPSSAAREAAWRATRMLGASKPPSARLAVVLEPWVTAQLLEVLGGTLCGDVVAKGRSCFGQHLGEQVAPAALTLVDDPTDPDAFTATAIDGEGLATRRNLLIDGGELARFVHDATSARRAGTAPTGSAVRRGFKSTPSPGCLALRLDGGRGGVDELVAEVGDGILVCDVAGLHSGVNPTSGDLSTGASGLRIRSGAVAEPLREFTIASTLPRLLREVRRVGGDRTRFPMAAEGVTLLVDDVTVSGT